MATDVNSLSFLGRVAHYSGFSLALERKKVRTTLQAVADELFQEMNRERPPLFDLHAGENRLQPFVQGLMERHETIEPLLASRDQRVDQLQGLEMRLAIDTDNLGGILRRVALVFQKIFSWIFNLEGLNNLIEERKESLYNSLSQVVEKNQTFRILSGYELYLRYDISVHSVSPREILIKLVTENRNQTEDPTFASGTITLNRPFSEPQTPNFTIQVTESHTMFFYFRNNPNVVGYSAPEEARAHLQHIYRQIFPEREA